MVGLFEKIGKGIAIILLITVFIQFIWIWSTDCKNPAAKDFDLTKCVTGLVFLIIPTEVSIAQTFQSAPLFLLFVLFLYWKFVAPLER